MPLPAASPVTQPSPLALPSATIHLALTPTSPVTLNISHLRTLRTRSIHSTDHSHHHHKEPLPIMHATALSPFPRNHPPSARTAFRPNPLCHALLKIFLGA
ncbi:hypothetical protein BDU57DRAFT_508852 [Ampelomyces quisqualis]|uniref:Uncharacterized protein n=1 Tax=Ampelomyces quisqualis TaxID=50730 RepID=A0A6A5QYH8_AMPQU|nr:hypothetical protein BDU57DRAFT_508852 [Ampelomyces quisqualis]